MTSHIIYYKLNGSNIEENVVNNTAIHKAAAFLRFLVLDVSQVLIYFGQSIVFKIKSNLFPKISCPRHI